MSTKPASLSANLLEQQIKTFTDFDKELVAGASAKSIMADIHAKSRDLWQVKPDDLVVIEGFNPRTQNADYFAGIEELAQHMVEHGYMQDKPVSGYIAKQDGKSVIAVNDGHRRLAAVKRAIELGAKITTIPLVLKQSSDNMVDLTLSLLHSNEGQPFNMYEKSIIAKRLKNYGWDNTKIAKEMGCTGAFVGELLTLAGAPHAIQELVKSGQMSGTLAVQTVKKHGENASAVAKAATGSGKRVTAKELTPTDVKTRNAKKVAYELYKGLTKVFANDKAVKALDDKLYTELDALIAAVEKKPKVKAVKVPKPPKAPKPIKVKAPKKPLAKKVADANKKVAPWDDPAYKKSNGADGEARAGARSHHRDRSFRERRGS